MRDELGRFLPGSNTGLKIKDDELKVEAYKSYCEHIAQGYPREAWHFEHPKYPICSDTMDTYIKDFPSLFPPILMRVAKAKSYKKWFCRGENLSDGKVKGNPSPQTWSVIMRNMFGWDRENHSRSDMETDVRRLLRKWEEVLE